MRQHPRLKLSPQAVILLGVMMLFASRFWKVEQVPPAEFQVIEEAKKIAKTEKTPTVIPAMSRTDSAEHAETVPLKPKEHPFANSSNPEIRELAKLVSCAQSRTCDFDQSQPNSYEFALGQAIANRIKKLSAERPSEEETRVARTFMTYPDDYVKSASLQILATSEPSAENMKALLTGLRDSASAPLLAEALDTLEKYKGNPELDKFLVDTVQTGGHFASIELAKNSLRFMSSENSIQFSSIKDQLPPESLSREYLEANLREFKRLQEGG